MSIKKYCVTTAILIVLVVLMSSCYISNFSEKVNFFSVLPLLLLTVAAIVFLPVLLFIWTVIIVTLLSIAILIWGISYLSITELVFYILFVPIYGLFLLSLLRLIHLAFHKKDFKQAEQFYKSLLPDRLTKLPMYAVLVNWAHFEQFREINLRETEHILNTIKKQLKLKIDIIQLFDLEDGYILLFTQEPRFSSRDYIVYCKSFLEQITFENSLRKNYIQIKIVKELLFSDNLKEEPFLELLNSLKRQLETEIIVEY